MYMIAFWSVLGIKTWENGILLLYSDKLFVFGKKGPLMLGIRQNFLTKYTQRLVQRRLVQRIRLE